MRLNITRSNLLFHKMENKSLFSYVRDRTGLIGACAIRFESWGLVWRVLFYITPFTVYRSLSFVTIDQKVILFRTGESMERDGRGWGMWEGGNILTEIC